MTSARGMCVQGALVEADDATIASVLLTTVGAALDGKVAHRARVCDYFAVLSHYASAAASNGRTAALVQVPSLPCCCACLPRGDTLHLCHVSSCRCGPSLRRMQCTQGCCLHSAEGTLQLPLDPKRATAFCGRWGQQSGGLQAL